MQSTARTAQAYILLKQVFNPKRHTDGIYSLNLDHCYRLSCGRASIIGYHGVINQNNVLYRIGRFVLCKGHLRKILFVVRSEAQTNIQTKDAIVQAENKQSFEAQTHSIAVQLVLLVCRVRQIFPCLFYFPTTSALLIKTTLLYRRSRR